MSEGRAERLARNSRSWYLRNREATIERTKRALLAAKEWIWSLKSGPCKDCLRTYPPYVMDFDHRPGETKLFEISKGYRRNARVTVLAEIAKCDLVCANCHRIRTHNRGKSR